MLARAGHGHILAGLFFGFGVAVVGIFTLLLCNLIVVKLNLSAHGAV